MNEDPKVVTEAAFIALLMVVMAGAALYWLIANHAG